MKYLLILTIGVSALTGYIFLQVPTELEPKAFQKSFNASANPILIDVRTPYEFANGHIPGAMNVDWLSPTFNWRIAELDTARPVFLYCRTAGKSSFAAAHLRGNGFTSVTELIGGIDRWNKANLTITPGEIIPPVELEFTTFSRLLDLEHLVLVDFYLPWDTTCQKMEPIIDDLSIKYKGDFKVLRVNIDIYKHLATELGIEALPVIQFYENGNLTFTWEGITKRSLIEKDIAIYMNQAAANF